MNEIWKPVIGYEDIYDVSTRGRIRNARGLILRTGDNGRGYINVKLAKNGRKQHQYIHRIVAAAFLGPSQLEINHKDGIKSNNRVDNLEYTTRQGNALHTRRILGLAVGESHCYAKLTEKAVKEIRRLAQTNLSYQAIADQFGIAVGTVSKVVSGRTWQCVSQGLNAPRRINRGELNGSTKITEGDVRDIRRMAAEGISHAKIRTRFGIALVTISRIVNRRSWAHVQ